MTTFAHSGRSRVQLTLFAEASHAKTSAPQAAKPASKSALGQVSFTNSCESFAWWDRDSSYWKTSQPLLTGGWTSFLENWPKQGLMQSGHVFRRVLWAPVTAGTAGGLLPTGPDGTPGLPTPSACIANDGERPETWLARRERVKLTANNGTGMGMPLTIAAQLLPTPVAQTSQGGPKGLDGGAGARQMLADAGFPRAVGAPTALPTPRICSAMASRLDTAGNADPARFPNLETVADALMRDDSTQTGGPTYLNPSFVEEMMGFPVGWTA